MMKRARKKRSAGYSFVQNAYFSYLLCCLSFRTLYDGFSSLFAGIDSLARLSPLVLHNHNRSFDAISAPRPTADMHRPRLLFEGVGGKGHSGAVAAQRAGPAPGRR